MPTRLTTDQFIQKAIAVHGNKYDYKGVDYNYSYLKVKIICSLHGEFEQTPTDHLKGRGCPKCGYIAKTKSREVFIEDAKKIHGNKYDYSCVDYKHCKSKVKIICPEHGEFEQRPRSHLGGQGCFKCKVAEQTKSTEWFIEEAKKIHGSKYDYSRVDYKHSKSKVKIVCSLHGEFEKTPSHHLWGTGCPKCGVAEQTKSTEVFIEDAKKVHGNKYDYSRVDYKNAESKVKIICPEHGEFEQRPYSHLRGCGCLKCGFVAQCGALTKSTEDFIEEAKKIHGSKYDYKHVNYKNSYSKVKIICPEHGKFEQTPNSHLRGQGCPKCAHELNTSKGEKEFLNEIKIPESDRQFRIYSLNCIVDGIDKKTNTVFEYLGDYWHGNPNTIPSSTKIKNKNMTCQQAYEYTFKRFSDIKSLGYNIKYIWESDWNAWKKNPSDPIPIKEYKD